MAHTTTTIPEAPLSSGGSIPLIGMGTAASPPVPPETTIEAVLEAIRVGYRHFDTASMYTTEQPLGKAIAEALSLGLIKSRSELFITSKLWCSDAHPHLVLPSLNKTLQNLDLEYLDLYLIHWPVSSRAGTYEYPIKDENFMAMEFKSVWGAMENCQKRGLTKAIGVSNFSCKKVADILEIAEIPPAVNQVEVNPIWQQKRLREFCDEKGIVVAAYAPLGARGTIWGSNKVMECQVLKDIAKAKGKTIAQICLRWAHEQGMCVLVKSFNKERMKENLQIYDWELSEEESKKISEVPQTRVCSGEDYISVNGPYKTVEELWDGEI